MLSRAAKGGQGLRLSSDRWCWILLLNFCFLRLDILKSAGERAEQV